MFQKYHFLKVSKQSPEKYMSTELKKRNEGCCRMSNFVLHTDLSF
jgi:hypothetical protein